jgi:hypothetical protein
MSTRGGQLEPLKRIDCRERRIQDVEEGPVDAHSTGESEVRFTVTFPVDALGSS